MKAHLAICSIGVFACDESGKLIDKEIFERNSEHVAKKFSFLNNGKIIPELEELYGRIHKNYDELTIEAEHNFGLNLVIEMPNLCGKVLRRNLRDLAAEFGFHPIEHFSYNLGRVFTEQRLQIELAKPDKKIIQVVSALNEINEGSNILTERFNEWELLNLEEKDASVLKKFGTSVSDLNSIKKFLEKYLEDLMSDNFPNLRTVAGAQISGRLIAQAGSSQRLARMASSKIQVLGAEKALFRHLKTGAKPPKYGHILKHHLVSSAPKHFRGKIARLVAAKISIAIKKDVYSKENVGQNLRKDLEEKVRKITRKR